MSQLPRPLSAIFHLNQLVPVCNSNKPYLSGPEQDNPFIIDSTDCSIVFGTDGSILSLGSHSEVERDMLAKFGSNWNQGVEVTDGTGCSAIPGLLDAHTHPVWAGDRVIEFDLKLRGATYMDIHRQGGGIHFTVDKTQAASQESLLNSLLTRLSEMASCGTTTVECKTGYGLDMATELKMLRVIERARSKIPVELVSTFLGAHAVPLGMNADQATEHACEMMRHIGSQSGYGKVEFIDVFCENGVYDIEQSCKILQSGLQSFPGSMAAFHGDELCDLGSGQLAARVSARSVSHLEFVSELSLDQMAASKVAAVLCPTTCYLLRLRNPPVMQMLKKGVPIVIATDYNPNAMCYSLPMAMNLAAVRLGLSLSETLTAVTLNAAYALNRHTTHGSLQVGKRGDLVLIKAPDWRHLVYQFGDTAKMVKAVFKNGQVIYAQS